MELQFSITPAHTEARLAEKLPQALLEHEQRQARIMATVTRWQKRLFRPSLLILGLIGGTLALYFPERRFTPEKIIALVICGLIFIPLWWRYSERWLNHLQALAAARQARRRAPLRELNQRLIAARLRAPLKAAEGAYRLSFDDQGFTLSNARGGKSHLAWTQVSQVQESADCYALASAEMARKGLACRIAKHSELMPAELYQQGLQAFLSQCPVALPAN